MNLLHERTAHLCAELRLERMAIDYPALAQKAAEEEAIPPPRSMQPTGVGWG